PEVDLYLALLRREASLPPTLLSALPSEEQVLGRTAPPFQGVAASLLERASPGAIHSAFEQGALRGADAVVLAAWALRQAGGRDWRRFRESKASWLRGAGASGGALRVVNRLEAAPLLARGGSRATPPHATGQGRLPLALGAGAGLMVALVLRLRHG